MAEAFGAVEPGDPVGSPGADVEGNDAGGSTGSPEDIGDMEDDDSEMRLRLLEALGPVAEAVGGSSASSAAPRPAAEEQEALDEDDAAFFEDSRGVEAGDEDDASLFFEDSSGIGSFHGCPADDHGQAPPVAAPAVPGPVSAAAGVLQSGGRHPGQQVAQGGADGGEVCAAGRQLAELREEEHIPVPDVPPADDLAGLLRERSGLSILAKYSSAVRANAVAGPTRKRSGRGILAKYSSVLRATEVGHEIHKRRAPGGRGQPPRPTFAAHGEESIFSYRRPRARGGGRGKGHACGRWGQDGFGHGS